MPSMRFELSMDLAVHFEFTLCYWFSIFDNVQLSFARLCTSLAIPFHWITGAVTLSAMGDLHCLGSMMRSIGAARDLCTTAAREETGNETAWTSHRFV